MIIMIPLCYIFGAKFQIGYLSKPHQEACNTINNTVKIFGIFLKTTSKATLEFSKTQHFNV